MSLNIRLCTFPPRGAPREVDTDEPDEPGRRHRAPLRRHRAADAEGAAPAARGAVPERGAGRRGDGRHEGHGQGVGDRSLGPPGPQARGVRQAAQRPVGRPRGDPRRTDTGAHRPRTAQGRRPTARRAPEGPRPARAAPETGTGTRPGTGTGPGARAGAGGRARTRAGRADARGGVRRALRARGPRPRPPDVPADRTPPALPGGRRARLPPRLGALARGGRGRRPGRLGAGGGVRVRPLPLAPAAPHPQAPRRPADRGRAAGAARGAARPAGAVPPHRPALRRARARPARDGRRDGGQHAGRRQPAAVRARGDRQAGAGTGRPRGAPAAARRPGGGGAVGDAAGGPDGPRRQRTAEPAADPGGGRGDGGAGLRHGPDGGDGADPLHPGRRARPDRERRPGARRAAEARRGGRGAARPAAVRAEPGAHALTACRAAVRVSPRGWRAPAWRSRWGSCRPSHRRPPGPPSSPGRCRRSRRRWRRRGPWSCPRAR